MSGASSLDGKLGQAVQNRQPCAFLTSGRNRLAYLETGVARADANRPTIVFLGGFRSNMRGQKAEHLAGWCEAYELGFLRFDYSGHGESSGEFADGTVGQWRDDALCVIDQLAAGSVVLIGSSMGAWMAVLAALARPEKVVGLMGIAAAPDFTEDLVPRRLTESERQRLWRDGRIERLSAYSEQPDVLTRSLLEEGRNHLVLRSPLALDCPLRLIHGLADPDVPVEQSRRLIEVWQGKNTKLILVEDGDHRLSRPSDLARISDLLLDLLVQIGFPVSK